MKSTKKRALYVIAALLGALFVLACLAGFAACGGSTEDDDGNNSDHTHSYTSSVTKVATCTEKGVRTYVCSCGDSYTEEIAIDPTNHDYVAVVTAATCGAAGFTTYTCSRCKDTYTEEGEAATGQHSWGTTGTVTKAATCTEDGEETYTCTNCDATKTETIAALGHTWDEGVVTKEATYTAEGEMTYTCSVCGETKTEAIAKLSAKSFAEADWSEIADVTESGAAESIYNIGDTKTVTLTAADNSTEDIEIRIIGFDHDGENTITLEMTETLNTKHAMNSSKTNAGGWAQSEMRTYLNETVFDTLPEDLQSVITPVNKTTSAGTDTTMTTSRDKLFLLSLAEIFSSTAITNSTNSGLSAYASTYTQEGTQYEYYKDKIGDQNSGSACDSLVKTYNGSADWWWLRSASQNNSTYFLAVYTAGNPGGDVADYAEAVSFCFVVGETQYSDFADATWDEISEVADAGLASDKYELGDTKTITLTTDEDTTEEIKVRIVDFGETTITLETTSCLETSYKMNNSASNVGGWESSALKTTLNDTVYQSLPEELQKVITETTVKSIKGLDDDGNAEYSEASEKLYIPSVANIYSADAIKACSLNLFATYADAYAAEDEQFGYYEQIDAQSLSAANEELANGTTYWLRSMSLGDSEYFETMNYTGQVNSQSARYAAGVSFCFAI